MEIPWQQLRCWSRSKAKPRSQGLYHTKPESNELAPRRCNFLSYTTQKTQDVIKDINLCLQKQLKRAPSCLSLWFLSLGNCFLFFCFFQADEKGLNLFQGTVLEP